MKNAETLRRLLRDCQGNLNNAIIFCNRKREVALFSKSLQKHGFSVGALHGDMDQSARTAALDQFRKGEIPLLVAFDVAARGLDIPAVSHVFNFDVPHHADDYVHRIGRTGRAGRAGTAISIVAPLDHKSIAAIEKLIGQVIPRIDAGSESRADSPAPPVKDEAEQPRQSRVREGAEKADVRGRVGLANRAASANRDVRAAATPNRKPRSPAAGALSPAIAQPSRTPSIGRHPAPQTSDQLVVEEPADTLASARIPFAARSRQGLDFPTSGRDLFTPDSFPSPILSAII